VAICSRWPGPLGGLSEDSCIGGRTAPYRCTSSAKIRAFLWLPGRALAAASSADGYGPAPRCQRLVDENLDRASVRPPAPRPREVGRELLVSRLTAS
jgi:hypothetical protein